MLSDSMSREEQLRLWKLNKLKRNRNEVDGKKTVNAQQSKDAPAKRQKIAALSRVTLTTRTRQENKQKADPNLAKDSRSILHSLDSNTMNAYKLAQEAAGLGKLPPSQKPAKKNKKKANKPKVLVAPDCPAAKPAAERKQPLQTAALSSTSLSSQAATPSQAGQVVAATPVTEARQPAFPQRTPRRAPHLPVLTTKTHSAHRHAHCAEPALPGSANKVQPASSARRPAYQEAVLSMREKLELWRAERSEKTLREQQASALKARPNFTPGPQASTLMLAAKGRIKQGDFHGAENLFARIEASQLLSSQAFPRADYWVQRIYANEKLGHYTKCVRMYEQAKKHRAQPFNAVLMSFQRFKKLFWETMTEQQWPDFDDSFGLDDSDEVEDGSSKNCEQVPMDTSEDNVKQPVAKPVSSSPAMQQPNAALTLTELRHAALHSPPAKLEFTNRPLVRNLAAAMHEEASSTANSSQQIGTATATAAVAKAKAPLPTEDKEDCVEDLLSLSDEMDELVEENEEESSEDLAEQPTEVAADAAQQSQTQDEQLPAQANAKDDDEKTEILLLPESEHVTEDDVKELLINVQKAPTPTKATQTEELLQACAARQGNAVERVEGGSFIALQPVKANATFLAASPDKAGEAMGSFILSPVRRSARLQPRQNMNEVLQLLAAAQYNYSPNPALEVKRAKPLAEDETDSNEPKTSPKSKRVCQRCLSTRAHSYVRRPDNSILCRGCHVFVGDAAWTRSDTPRPVKTVSTTSSPSSVAACSPSTVQSTHPEKPKRALPPVPIFAKPDTDAENSQATLGSAQRISTGTMALGSAQRIPTPIPNKRLRRSMSETGMQANGEPVRRSPRICRASQYA
eukprot:g37298.t1